MRIIAGLPAVAMGCGAALGAGAPPSVLFIAVDDMRPELGYYGNTK